MESVMEKKIKNLVETDVHFVDFVTILYKVHEDKRDLVNAWSTCRRLGVKISDDMEFAIRLYSKKEDCASRTLETLYHLTWHYYDIAYKACGLI